MWEHWELDLWSPQLMCGLLRLFCTMCWGCREIPKKIFYCPGDHFSKRSKDLTFKISMSANSPECQCKYLIWIFQASNSFTHQITGNKAQHMSKCWKCGWFCTCMCLESNNFFLTGSWRKNMLSWNLSSQCIEGSVQRVVKNMEGAISNGKQSTIL